MNTTTTTSPTSGTTGRLSEAALLRGLGAGDPAAIADAWQVGRHLWPVLRTLGYQAGFVGGRGANSDALAGRPPHLRPSGAPAGYRAFVATIPDASGHYDIQLQHLPADLPRLPEYRGQLDVVLQDVPFKQWPTTTRQTPSRAAGTTPGQGQALADYGTEYLTQAITLSTRGGISVSLVHPQVLDSPDPTGRQALARQADLVGALRLPPRASPNGTGTGVDVVMLRRRSHGTRSTGPGFTDLSTVRVGDRWARVNEYFATHPGNVLGRVLPGPDASLLMVPAGDRAGLGQQMQDAFKLIGGAATQLKLTAPGHLSTQPEHRLEPTTPYDRGGSDTSQATMSL
ncbi:hypothetical protein ACFT2C_04795 [Promicromonospora sp. NPDC057138]|uniref:hypothetical protein n=1 Tax=Promicromonospora sp. NPDC057138 TaxID=3346031 RepID=UPI00362CF2A8